MEDHTTKCNTIHTQLLLQMQIDSNIQEMREKLHSTQNELQTTKATLYSTQNELVKTKLKLEQTIEELDLSKEDAAKKEDQIKFLQENIQNHNNDVLKLNHQISENFATCWSRMITSDGITLEKVFKSLETKEPLPQPDDDQIELIREIDINGTKLEFPKVNELVQKLTMKDPYESHEEKFEFLLKKMENGQYYHIDNRQVIFKLHFPKNHRNLHISYTTNVASAVNSYPNNVVVSNNQLVLLDNLNNRNDYQIYLQILNYSNNSKILNYSNNSKIYLFHKSENGAKLLLNNGNWNDNINMDIYKTAASEVLFHITK